jgi:hypothetical protein
MLGEDAGDATDDGFGHRHQQVWRVDAHRPEVTFEYDPAVVHYEDGVSPGVREHRPERRRAGLKASGRDIIYHKQIVGILERPGGNATRDALGRDHFPQMLEGPPDERRLLPVRQVHHRLARWWEALHRGVIGHGAHLIPGRRPESHQQPAIHSPKIVAAAWSASARSVLLRPHREPNGRDRAFGAGPVITGTGAMAASGGGRVRCRCGTFRHRPCG